MKVYVSGFWHDFFTFNSTYNSTFFIDLLGKIFNQPIELGDFYESDVLLESLFWKKTVLYEKKWKYSLFFIGESVKNASHYFEEKKGGLSFLKDFDVVLYGKHNSKNNIKLPLFIPYIYSNNFLHRLENPLKITNIPKKNICAIISNGTNAPERNLFLEKLEKRFHIDYAGRYNNNTQRIIHDYNTEEFLNAISEYKFIIAIENSKEETYITEKIIHGFISGIIPIYWGSTSIHDYFCKDRFINIEEMNDENIDAAINRMEEIINNDEKYLNIVNKLVFKNGKLERNIDNIVNDIKKKLQIQL